MKPEFAHPFDRVRWRLFFELLAWERAVPVLRSFGFGDLHRGPLHAIARDAIAQMLLGDDGGGPNWSEQEVVNATMAHIAEELGGEAHERVLLLASMLDSFGLDTPAYYDWMRVLRVWRRKVISDPALGDSALGRLRGLTEQDNVAWQQRRALEASVDAEPLSDAEREYTRNGRVSPIQALYFIPEELAAKQFWTEVRAVLTSSELAVLTEWLNEQERLEDERAGRKPRGPRALDDRELAP